MGLGGELSQDAQRQLHPVAYFSRALTKRERSYPTYDREVTAMRDTLLSVFFKCLKAFSVLSVRSTSSDEDRPQTSFKDPGTERSFWTKSDIDERYSII